MRIKFGTPKITGNENYRYVEKFAWIPVKINNDFRWLEHVKYIDRAVLETSGSNVVLKWRHFEFIDEIPNLKWSFHYKEQFTTDKFAKQLNLTNSDAANILELLNKNFVSKHG